MFNSMYRAYNLPERWVAEDRRKARLNTEDIAARRLAEVAKYAAYEKACKGLYAVKADLQDKDGLVCPPTWSPDSSETWEWFWQLVDGGRDELQRGMIVSCVLPEERLTPFVDVDPQVSCAFKRVDVRLERLNFQKIDDLFPEEGNIVRLANNESEMNLLAYLIKAGTPGNNA